jgi:hypothetical protein
MQLLRESGVSYPSEGGHMFSSNPQECAYCRSAIASGQPWVREKIYEPTLVGQDPRYHRYHADLFAGEELSCWEKYQMQSEIARAIKRAA